MRGSERPAQARLPAIDPTRAAVTSTMSLAKRASQFARLSSEERRLLIRAAGWVVIARAALWLLPFSAVRHAFDRPRSRRSDLSFIRPRRLSWAVQTSARWVPQATCLTQALALQALMAQAGRMGDVHLGVTKDAPGGFEAHAWVEHDGEIILGDNGGVARYARMMALRAPALR